MDKEQLIAYIRGQVAAGTIAREDLLALAGEGGAQPVAVASVPAESHTQRNLVNVFYGIGAIIVLSGIIVLIAQYWTDIGYLGRVLVTLGIALVSLVAGTCMRSPGQRIISQVFFTLAAALFPLGVYVVLHEHTMEFTLRTQLLVSAGLALLFGVAWLINRRSILPLFIVGYLTWAYYTFLIDVLDIAMHGNDLLTWATLVAGLAYVAVGLGFRPQSTVDDPEAGRERHSVRTVLYGLGTLAALGAGISLEGIWDLAYIPLIFGAFYASVYLRSRAVLVLAGVFLIAHLIMLTSEYFADSIGWPIALVVIGFLIIGIGYGTYYIGKKYIHS